VCASNVASYSQFYHTAKTQKSYVAEIGTGEGKSVVIALLAAYLALQGKTVHVLVNNRALLKRDYATNQGFFTMLGLTSAEGTSAPGESDGIADFEGADLEGDLDDEGESREGGERAAAQEPSIRYLVMSDISTLWRKQVLQDKDSSPFRQHVLVVDEVDELIVDEIPLFCHMSSFPHLNEQLRTSYDALLANHNATRPESVTDDYVWDHALEARAEAAKMVQGEHFVLEDGRYWKREEKVSPSDALMH
jgi:preprotein translocase subunit SecA